MNQDEKINSIGHVAQILDAEYSIIERMKIKKETLTRLGYAGILYITIMIFFAIVF